MPLLNNSKRVVSSIASSVIAAVSLITLVMVLQVLPFEEKIAQAKPLLRPFTLEHELTGKAAVLYDLKTHTVLYAKNADLPLPLASLTKLMTAQTVLSNVAGDTSVQITSQDLAPEGDWGLKPGEVWPLSALITYGLVASSNDAMAAAAASLDGNIAQKMNEVAQSLGLSNAYFANPTGLDVDLETAGAYGSAKDVVLFASAFLSQHPALFETTTHPNVTITSSSTSLTAAATEVPLLDIPGLIAAKTGYTDLAGGNLVAIFDVEINHPIVVVVLDSTRDGRFDDVRMLVEAARAQLNEK